MGNDDDNRSVAGRIPWLTFLMVAGCVAVTAWDLGSAVSLRAQLDSTLGEAVEYFETRPYLEPPPVLAQRLGEEAVDQKRRSFQLERRRRSAPAIPEGVVARSQEELDGLVGEALVSIGSQPVEGWGMRASSGEPARMLGHVLFHSSWLHLIGGIFFLVVLGFHLEGAWGPVIYGLFVLAALPVTSGVFSLAHPEEPRLWVGSSGLVAAQLGAFALRFRGKGHDGSWPLLLVSGAVWLLLPVWLGVEWSLGGGIGAGLLGPGSPGVSYGIFGVGFGFGALAALGVAGVGIEESLLGPAREAKQTRVAKPLLEQAMADRAAGRHERAFGILSRCLKRHPGDCDVALALWDVAQHLGRSSEAAGAMLSVIRDEIRRRDEAGAVDHWLELDATGLSAGADLNLVIKIAALLRKYGRESAASEALRRALDLADGSSVVASRVAREARGLDRATAQRAAWSALASADLDYEERRNLEAMLGELEGEQGGFVPGAKQEIDLPGGPGAETELPGDSAAEAQELAAEAEAGNGEDRPAARPAPIDIGVASRPYVVKEVRPVALERAGLRVEAAGGEKRLVDPSRIDAIAVGAVGGISAKPVILVDLVLNWTSSFDEPLRVVRLRSDRFDPRRLKPEASSPGEALRAFIERLLRRSGATPLPDERAVLGQPFGVFDSLQAYQRDVLMVDEPPEPDPR